MGYERLDERCGEQMLFLHEYVEHNAVLRVGQRRVRQNLGRQPLFLRRSWRVLLSRWDQSFKLQDHHGVFLSVGAGHGDRSISRSLRGRDWTEQSKSQPSQGRTLSV